jgi:hypothetical protein
MWEGADRYSIDRKNAKEVFFQSTATELNLRRIDIPHFVHVGGALVFC